MNSAIFITVILWGLGSLFAGFIAMDRKAGFFLTFIIALLLSPIAGLIYGLESPRNSDIEYKQKMLKYHKQQVKLLEEIKKLLMEEKPDTE